jgi:hypothetical protein
MMTKRRPDGGRNWVELLLVIVIVAMFATIVATTMGVFPQTSSGACDELNSDVADRKARAPDHAQILSSHDQAGRRKSLEGAVVE